MAAPSPKQQSSLRVDDVQRLVVVVDVRGGGVDYDLIVDVLWRFEPVAVSETEIDAAAGAQGDPATDGLVRLTAAYKAAADAAGAHALLADAGARLVHGDDGDWVSNWRAAEPAWVVGGFFLRLPEHDRGNSELTDLVIEPSTTFGFSHPSTRLALELVDIARTAGTEVVDIGCGSGVLAIAAAKRGATKVVGVDIDEHAVAMTNANAATNDVAIEAHVGSTELVAAQQFDLVLLNVTAGTSFPMAETIAHLTRPGGTLITSGILAAQREVATQRFGGFVVTAERSEGDWVALQLQRLG